MQQHWSYRLALYAAFFSSGAQILLLILYRTSLPPAVPLWFSRPWGGDQLAHPAWLLLLPISNLLVFLTNTILAMTLLAGHPTFARVILVTSIFVSTLSLVAIANILNLVL
jgi:hypothetical protein